jgi:hypothetical protein
MIALLLIAVSLGLSNFAASIGIGISGVDNRTRLRVGLIFGVFEAAMPVAGLALGRALTGPLGANALSSAGQYSSRLVSTTSPRPTAAAAPTTLSNPPMRHPTPNPHPSTPGSYWSPGLH